MHKMFDVSGKVAIVTGASRGIGEAIARTFAESGMKVVLSSRKQESLDALAADMRAHGHDVLPVAAHNGQKDALQGLVTRAVEVYGGLDVLVNNADQSPLWHAARSPRLDVAKNA